MLVARLRLRDERAAAELFVRWAPLLLHEAARWRVDPGARREVVMDAITAAALVLMRSDTPVPGSLGGYLVTTLRRRILNRRRDHARLAALHVRLDVDVAAPADAPASAAAPAQPLAQLARVLDQHLTDRDRQLLAWLGDRVPQREIAGWIGSTYGALRVRVLRLRERLREIARRHAATLPPDERAELERWLQQVAGHRHSPSTGPQGAPGGKRNGTST